MLQIVSIFDFENLIFSYPVKSRLMIHFRRNHTPLRLKNSWANNFVLLYKMYNIHLKKLDNAEYHPSLIRNPLYWSKKRNSTRIELE